MSLRDKYGGDFHSLNNAFFVTKGLGYRGTVATGMPIGETFDIWRTFFPDKTRGADAIFIGLAGAGRAGLSFYDDGGLFIHPAGITTAAARQLVIDFLPVGTGIVGLYKQAMELRIPIFGCKGAPPYQCQISQWGASARGNDTIVDFWEKADLANRWKRKEPTE